MQRLYRRLGKSQEKSGFLYRIASKLISTDKTQPQGRAFGRAQSLAFAGIFSMFGGKHEHGSLQTNLVKNDLCKEPCSSPAFLRRYLRGLSMSGDCSELFPANSYNGNLCWMIERRRICGRCVDDRIWETGTIFGNWDQGFDGEITIGAERF